MVEFLLSAIYILSLIIDRATPVPTMVLKTYIIVIISFIINYSKNRLSIEQLQSAMLI